MLNVTVERPLWDKLELPTWLVVVGVYAAWGALVYAGGGLPWWIFCPLGAVIIAWHGSVQHELLHGHPTRSVWFNSILGWMPLGLWMPYHVYRENHLLHHRVATLTQPGEDPESYYFMQQDWASLCPVRRGILRANNTLLGRVTLGPMIVLVRFGISELRLLAEGNLSRLPGWIFHAVLMSSLLYGLDHYLGIPAWYYAIGCAYPGISFILVRSFLEHRPSDIPAHRTAVVEGNWFWSLLFLNVNFHVPHHDHPGIPWYRVPALYRAERDAILERNGGYMFRSYGQVARQYLLRPKDMPVYPVR
ncbi:MAG: fatty acid desaturase [Rhodospirillales bacterium]|nr:fatty acid desaturase [Rhodospirillales bacterium]